MILLLNILIFSVAFLSYKFFRPYFYLRKLKTPRSSLYLLGSTLSLFGTPTEKFQNVVRFFFEVGPTGLVWLYTMPQVLIGKPEDCETLMQSQSLIEKHYFYKFTRYVVGEGIFSAPVQKWKCNRKVILQTFNKKIIENFLPIFNRTATTFVNEILPKNLGKKETNWYSLLTSVQLDSICQTAMGINNDVQRKHFPFADWLETSLTSIFIRMFNVFYHLDLVFFNFIKIGRALKTAKNNLFAFTDQVIRDKKQVRSNKNNPKQDDDLIVFDSFNKKNFLDQLLDLNQKGIRKFTDKDLRDEVNTFFVGGTDTSAVTSCFFLELMGMHREIQDQVYNEIIDVLGHEEKIPTMDELNNLKLLERCIKETLRIFPPAPFVARKATEDVKFSEGIVPKGAGVIFMIFYLHRSELYWKDPLKFDPDRFLPDQVLNRHPYNFLPFSGGLRGCVGSHYSYVNLKNLLSMVLRQYEVYSDVEKIEDIELKDIIVLRPIDGFKFYLEKRKIK